jgi:integrase
MGAAPEVKVDQADRHVTFPTYAKRWWARAGWPKEHGGFHALRHFFATTLITHHADSKEIQRAPRHSTLQITLEMYVHFWPHRERRRGVVGDVLRAAAERRATA